MIGGDQTIPGADGGGNKPFSVIEQADFHKAPEKSGGSTFAEIEQEDNFPDKRLNLEKIAEKKALDEKQILDALQVLEDIGFRPNWRDIYEAQKNKDAAAQVTESGAMAAERKARDEKQILDAFQVFEDIGFRFNWRDIYEAQKKGVTGKSSPFTKADEILDLTKSVGGPAVSPGWRDQIASAPKITK